MNHNKFSEALISALKQSGNSIVYEPGAFIHLLHEQSPRLYFLIRGRCRGFLLNDQGNEITLEVIPSGRVFGESSLINRYDEQIHLQAVTKCELISISKTALTALMREHPDLAWTIMERLVETIDSLSQQVKRLTMLKGASRLADYLLAVTEDPDPDLGILNGMIPYSHMDLALVLGMRRETVSRLLKEFESQGCLKLGYGKITVINQNKLSRIAQEIKSEL